MPMLVCVNATARSEYVELNLGDGRSALDLLVERVEELPDVSEVVVLVTAEDQWRYPERWQRVFVRDCRESSLLQSLLKAHGDNQGSDLILYCQIDAPFLDPALCSAMAEQHTRYAAEYSFADGYPAGLAPELLAPSVLPRLLQLAEDTENSTSLPRDVLFQIIQRDINSFDIETTLSEHDMRMLRIELYCNTRRNWVLCKRLVERGVDGAEPIVEAIRADQGLLRTLVAYVMIDVVEGNLQDVAYSPYRLFGPSGKGKQREMATADVRGIVEQLTQFSPQSVMSFGLWGEPALHSDPVGLVAAARPCPLVIETSGVGWDEAALQGAIEAGGADLSWIVHLDAVDPDVYRGVRGQGFEQAMRVCERLLQTVPSQTYIQTVRYADVEQHTEQFYRHWKQRTENIIVQKYDHFCGVLEDKRITDISPVNRFPCWHLKRDLTVLVDGSVPLCREDIHGEHIVGNVLHSGVQAVWEALEPYYRKHVEADYPLICRNCDEYYTFNF